MINESTLRALAVACFTNANQLCDEAKLLIQQDRFPRAAALAVIGAEEFGKAVIYTMAALVPEDRQLLPRSLRNHELKHRICSLAEVAKIMNEDYWAAIGRPDSALTRLTDLFVPLVEHGLASSLNEQEARHYYQHLRQRHQELQHRDTFQSQEQRDWGLPFREPDLKNASLYVDIDTNDSVLTPNRVGPRDAMVAIESLAWFLEQYAELSSVVTDEQTWRDFASEVDRRRPIIRPASE